MTERGQDLRRPWGEHILSGAPSEEAQNHGKSSLGSRELFLPGKNIVTGLVSAFFPSLLNSKGFNLPQASQDQLLSFSSLSVSLPPLVGQCFRLALCCKWFSKVYPKMKGFSPNYICTHIHTYISGLSDTFYLKLFIGLCFSTQRSPKQWTTNDPNQTPLEQFCILHAKKCSHNKVTKWMSLCLNRGIKLNCDKSKLFKGSLVHVYQITLNIMCWTKALILLVLSNRNVLRNKPIFLL